MSEETKKPWLSINWNELAKGAATAVVAALLTYFANYFGLPAPKVEVKVDGAAAQVTTVR